MQQHKPYHPRDQRPSPLTVVELTSRDLTLLKAVYECRVLTQDQLHRLIFHECNAKAVHRRLLKLFRGKFLDRDFRLVRGGLLTSPALYLLDSEGAEALRRANFPMPIAWSKSHNRVSHSFLDHLLGINEVRIAVTLACQQYDLVLAQWSGEREMKHAYDQVQVGDMRLPILPDSHFIIHNPQEPQKEPSHFFLELDRGTEALKRFRRKIEAYITYVESGAYTARYHTKSLRILTVTESQRRLENLKRITEDVGGKSRFWFACLSDLTPETVFTAPVWQVAGQTNSATLIHISKAKGLPQEWQPLHQFLSTLFQGYF